MIRNVLSFVVLLVLFSCHNNSTSDQAAAQPQSTAQQPAAQPQTASRPASSPEMPSAAGSSAIAKNNLKVLKYDYKKDPACGMPLTAGLEDTLQYKGKLYGFCSRECKAAFIKDPATYLAQIKPAPRQ
jgi:YHS domain-containing protein